MTLTILEGSTFCICDDIGDFDSGTAGLFAEDTRFLSKLMLRVNGARPLLLSSAKVEYFSAAFYMRNPLAGGLDQDQVSIARLRFIGDGMQDHITLENQTLEPLSLQVTLDVGSDFADILAVKEHDFALGDPQRASALPPLAPVRYDGLHDQILIADQNGTEARMQIVLSPSGDVDGSTVTYSVGLDPRQRWDLRVEFVPSLDGEIVRPHLVEGRFGHERDRVADSLAAWRLRVPQLHSTWSSLEQAFSVSVSDLAALRMRGSATGSGRLPAAGMPWFMTVFGRDTLITCLQTLLFGPELASAALGELAELQATEDDPSIDAEPGKIVHEVRHGKAAENWFGRYYGSVDATPLYLVLLSEVWRWTDDANLVTNLREPALRALGWIETYGDRDGDGFVEYLKRAERGIDNQSWKDSHDSQRFRDGRQASPPIAPVEVQGYVYDAKLRTAELARHVWRDRELAERLEAEAVELFDRINDAFWTDERGGYYLLGLDGDKNQIDSICSNMGHLLWSGVVPPEREDAVVDKLMGPDLWSGWGVRTMAATESAYNPLSYHNGTVWPHDNSLIAWGLCRYGRWPEVQRIAQRMLEAAGHFAFELPEVFAGLPRAETLFPIAYPTAARPQAWAAGTPVLLLQALLGLRPDQERQVLEAVAPGLPSWAGRIRLTGVRAFDSQWDVLVEDGQVHVEELE